MVTACAGEPSAKIAISETKHNENALPSFRDISFSSVARIRIALRSVREALPECQRLVAMESRAGGWDRIREGSSG
jgi:hypothetical protein